VGGNTAATLTVGISLGLTASSNYEIQAPGCVTLVLDDSLALYKDGFEPPASYPCDD
jgi:hypothetical protein